MQDDWPMYCILKWPKRNLGPQFLWRVLCPCVSSAWDIQRNTLALGLQLIKPMSFTCCVNQAGPTDQLSSSLQRLTPEQWHSSEHSLDLLPRAAKLIWKSGEELGKNLSTCRLYSKEFHVQEQKVLKIVYFAFLKGCGFGGWRKWFSSVE